MSQHAHFENPLWQVCLSLINKWRFTWDLTFLFPFQLFSTYLGAINDVFLYGLSLLPVPKVIQTRKLAKKKFSFLWLGPESWSLDKQYIKCWAPVLILQHFKLLSRNLWKIPSCFHSRFILVQLCDSLLSLLWLCSILGCLVLLQLFESYGWKKNYFSLSNVIGFQPKKKGFLTYM